VNIVALAAMMVAMATGTALNDLDTSGCRMTIALASLPSMLVRAGIPRARSW
jgi:hypothetical protein